MDDTKDDARYPPIMDGDGYLNHKKHSVRSSPYSQPVTNEYVEDNDDEDREDVELLGDEENDDDDADQSNSIYLQNDFGDNDYEDDDENHGNNGNDDGGNDDTDEDDDGDDGGGKKSYKKRVEDDTEWHPKKRKLKSLVSAYEVAPRVPAAAPPPPSASAQISNPKPKPQFGSRNSLTDWNEHETFFLLDAWGNRFLQQGRKSLRSEQWQEVAEEVSEVSKTERTDTQCRNRLDTLKKKYKKEKAKLAETGVGSSKWVYFKRMDKLLSSFTPQHAGLSCGLDSGEYVFMNPRVYLNHANGLDETRDSPGNSESTGEDDEDLGGLGPKKRRHGRDRSDQTSCRLLAESIKKFGEIYEKIENSKRQQMVELEKMRMDFHRELETQKQQILERLQCEIAKLDQRDNENNDDPVEKDE